MQKEDLWESYIQINILCILLKVAIVIAIILNQLDKSLVQLL